MIETKTVTASDPWVGPGKPNLPLGLRRKAGGCGRVTAGPKRPHLGKGDQSWVFIGRADAEAETPVLWPPHVKS